LGQQTNSAVIGAGLRRTSGAADATTDDSRVSRFPRNLGLRLDETGTCANLGPFADTGNWIGAGADSRADSTARADGDSNAATDATAHARTRANTGAGAFVDADINAIGERHGRFECRQDEIDGEHSPRQTDRCVSGATATGAAEDDIRYAEDTDITDSLTAGSAVSPRGRGGTLADTQFGGS